MTANDRSLSNRSVIRRNIKNAAMPISAPIADSQREPRNGAVRASDTNREANAPAGCDDAEERIQRHWLGPTSDGSAAHGRIAMHRRADASDCGSATVTDPTSSTAVRHTRALLGGTTNVVDSRKKSPPLATVDGVVLATMPA
jgi:hypothetical protein